MLPAVQAWSAAFARQHAVRCALFSYESHMLVASWADLEGYLITYLLTYLIYYMACTQPRRNPSVAPVPLRTIAVLLVLRNLLLGMIACWQQALSWVRAW
jgi:hypothetical protein